jgi:mono/diheme cytochrome c family protein
VKGLAWVLVWTGLLPGAVPEAREPRALFERNCAVCHGADGRARGASGRPLPGRVLADARWQARTSDQAAVAAILEGKGAMPAFKVRLTPAEARALLKDPIRTWAAPSRPSR